MEFQEIKGHFVFIRHHCRCDVSPPSSAVNLHISNFCNKNSICGVWSKSETTSVATLTKHTHTHKHTHKTKNNNKKTSLIASTLL